MSKLTWRELHTLNYEGMHKYLEILESIRNGTAPLYGLDSSDDDSSILDEDIGIFLVYPTCIGSYYDFYSLRNIEVIKDRLDGSVSFANIKAVSFDELKTYIAIGAVPDCPKETSECFVHAYTYDGVDRYGHLCATYRGCVGQMPRED